MIKQYKVYSYNHCEDVDQDELLHKLDEAVARLDHAVETDDDEALKEAVGDVGFYLRSVAELEDVDVSPAINETIEERLADCTD